MRIICIGAVFPLLALLIFVGPAAATTMITGPMVITEPGNYRLANDIVNSDAFACIVVRTGGVTIDGRGHVIDGVKAANSVGLLVEFTASDAPDTIIKNLRFTDWGSGIQLWKAANSKIRLCTFADNTIGVEAYCTEFAEVSSCRFVGNGDGISWDGATDSVIRDSTFSGNENGIVLSSMLGCYRITIGSNVIDGSTDTGIRLVSTGGPITIQTNQVTNSGQVGLSLNDITGHVIANNFFNNMNNAAVPASVADTWNRAPAHGKNIVGGNRLGGNYWAKPDGTGFSQVTPDTNRDGFCDASYTIADLNVDQFPLHAR